MTVMRQKRSVGILDILTYLGLAAALAGLAAFPDQSVGAAKNGLRLCADLIVPSLFPFFVLSSMMIETGLADVLGKLMRPVMRLLFNVNGACSAPFLLGFIGGYPVGARSAIALYQRGQCGRDEAERMLSFCNNSGPAFILGVVGAGVFNDSRAGLLLYLVHFLSSVIVGIIFRGWHSGSSGSSASPAVAAPEMTERAGFAKAFTTCVKSAFSATLNICAFVIFFTVIIRLLFISGVIPALASAAAGLLSPLGVTADAAEGLITGVIEMTSGVSSLRDAAGSIGKSGAMAAFMLGWAGLSVHFQVLTFLCDSGLSAKTYILGKLLHGVISALLAGLAFSLLKLDVSVSGVLAQEVSGLSGMTALQTAALSLLALVPLLVLCAVLGVKKLYSGRG